MFVPLGIPHSWTFIFLVHRRPFLLGFSPGGHSSPEMALFLPRSVYSILSCSCRTSSGRVEPPGSWNVLWNPSTMLLESETGRREDITQSCSAPIISCSAWEQTSLQRITDPAPGPSAEAPDPQNQVQPRCRGPQPHNSCLNPCGRAPCVHIHCHVALPGGLGKYPVTKHSISVMTYLCLPMVIQTFEWSH